MHLRHKLAIILAIFCASFASLGHAQTTTFTGTIKDLSGAAVSSGNVTFTLQPGADTTISGSARFTPQTVTCGINGSGLVKANDLTNPCVVTNNTALTPAGTSWGIKICPSFACTSSLVTYALGGSVDITTLVATPAQMPAYSIVDIFQNQSIGGNKTFTGSTSLAGGGSLNGTFSGTATLSGAIAFTGGLNESAAGVFTSSQMNEYATFLLNGLSLATQFHAAQGAPNNATEGAACGVAVPSSSTVFQANGCAGYISNSSTVTNAVAGYFSAQALVGNAAVWGVNPVVMDNGFAARMIGAEIDNNVTNTATTGAGLTLLGSFSVNPVSYPAISVARPIGTGAWSSGILVGNNATSSGVGLSMGAFGAGNNVQSQSIQLFGTDSGGVQRTTSIYADPTGVIVLAPNVSSGNSVQILTGKLKAPSFVSGTANAAQTGNLNLASGDTIAFRNAANTADILIGHNSSDQIIFTGGILAPGEVLTAAAPTVSASQVGLGSTTSTTATAGTNGAVPAQVVGYLIINVAGTAAKVPYFAN